MDDSAAHGSLPDGVTGRVSCGVTLPAFGPYAEARRLAELAVSCERAGWDGLFLWDHIVFDPTFHPMADPWVALAAVAMRTERIRIGTMVTPLARRRPWKVARETVTLDRLSGGRLILGVGLGDPVQWDFGWFGEPQPARERADRLDEALDVLVGLWSGRPFAYAGRHHQVAEVTFTPTPMHGHIPIWVGGWWPNRRPLRRAARHDGMVPARWGEPLGPGELAEAVAYVRDRPGSNAAVDSGRAYDVVVTGSTDPRRPDESATHVASYVDQGATWWIEDCSPWAFGADWESAWQPEWTTRIEERVAAGPPVGRR